MKALIVIALLTIGFASCRNPKTSIDNTPVTDTTVVASDTIAVDSVLHND